MLNNVKSRNFSHICNVAERGNRFAGVHLWCTLEKINKIYFDTAKNPAQSPRMSNTNRIAVTEIQNGKVFSTWLENSLELAIAAVRTLKVSGAGKTFSLENMDGTVVEVIKM